MHVTFQAIGVAQVINKKGEEFFTKEDEDVSSKLVHSRSFDP